MTPRERIMEIIRDEGQAWDIPTRVILGRQRDLQAVRARYAAIRAVHNAFPLFSATHLAKIFNRDHTTILYALGRTSRKPKI